MKASEMKEELKKLVEEQQLVNSIKRSAQDTEKQFNEKVETFLIKHVGFQKNATFSLVDLLERVALD
jgi:hypothetical protein